MNNNFFLLIKNRILSETPVYLKQTKLETFLKHLKEDLLNE